MTKKWIAINLLLLVIAAGMGWQLRKAIISFDRQNDLSRIRPATDARKGLAGESVAPSAQQPSRSYDPMDYSIIPEKNVFSDSRSMDTGTETPMVPDVLPLTQKPILVGVTIMDSQRRASIIDPAAPGGSRRAQMKKVGDVYHGYTIKEIHPDQIVLESGTRREIIPLREGSKKNQGGKTPILSTRVVPIGAGGGISGTTPVTMGGTAVAVRQGSPATIQPAQVPGANQSIVVAPGTSQIRTAPSTSQPQGQISAKPIPSAPQPGQPAGTDSQGRRVFRTPFGDIIRPNR